MDFCRSQKQKQPSKHNKKRLNPEQVRLLERSFASDKMLEPERKLQLAEQLGVPPRQVAIWYQNKRARWKTQSLELEYSLLHQELENALLEKRRLEKDVERLKGELAKTQELVLALKQTGSSSQVSCTSISLDEVAGSSSLHNQRANCTVEKDEVFPLLDQDFYACLIGEDGSSWD